MKTLYVDFFRLSSVMCGVSVLHKIVERAAKRLESSENVQLSSAWTFVSFHEWLRNFVSSIFLVEDDLSVSFAYERARTIHVANFIDLNDVTAGEV